MHRGAWDDEVPPVLEAVCKDSDKACCDNTEVTDTEVEGGENGCLEMELSKALKRRANICAAAKQWHKHCFTCQKLPNGECGCRLAMPAGHPVPRTRTVNVRELPTQKELNTKMPSGKKSELDAKGERDTESTKEQEQQKPTLAELERCFPSSEVHVPAEELSCAGAMPGTAWFLQCQKGCHPTGIDNKSALHTGELWLTVTNAQKEHAVKRREALTEKAAKEKTAEERANPMEQDNETSEEVGTSNKEEAKPR